MTAWKIFLMTAFRMTAFRRGMQVGSLDMIKETLLAVTDLAPAGG